MHWIKAILRLKAVFPLLYFVLLVFLKKKPKIRYYSQRNYIIIYLAGISLQIEKILFVRCGKKLTKKILFSFVHPRNDLFHYK